MTLKRTTLVAVTIGFLLLIVDFGFGWDRPSGKSVAWKKHVVVEQSKTAINSAQANDFDGDGQMDVIASYCRGVYLLKGPDWKPHKIFQFSEGLSRNKPGAVCIHSCLMDADHDGDLDFVGSNQTLFWLECPDQPFSGEAWKYRTIDDKILGSHCVLPGDVNGDGVTDLIANSFRDASKTEFPESIVYFDGSSDVKNTSQWKRIVFADKDAPGGSHYMGLGDLNGDGRADISCGAKGDPFENGNWFAWWEQPVGGGAWKKHLVAENETGASNIDPVDVDGDKVMDLVATRGHGQGVLWFKGPDFKPFQIDRSIQFPHTLATDDLDGDGDTDVAVCGSKSDGIAAWYQNDGQGKFKRFDIDRGQGSYDLRAYDMDQDGDLDLLNAGHNNKNLVWYENTMKKNRPIANSVGATDDGIRFKPKLLTIDANEGIDLADIDKDGKLDVVAGRSWYRAPDFVPLPLRLIEDWNGYVHSNGDFCMDVDQDGLIDVVAGAFIPTEVNWFKNPGAEGLKLGQVWKKNLLVDTKLSQNEASFLRDMDGDGKPEWITNSWKKTNPVVVWKFETVEKEFTKTVGRGKKAKQVKEKRAVPSLKKHVIGLDGNTHGMGFGDINNDGREDVLIATGWYERPEGDALSKRWKFHNDWDDDLHASCPMLVRDLDGDGKNDLIWGRGHDYGLYWWQSQGVGEDGKLKFKQHEIDNRYSQPHTIHFADLDGDGQEELISGKRVRAHNGNDPGGKDIPVMYYYKWNKSANSFKRFAIDEGHIGIGLQIRTGDLNGDGKLDIAVAGKDGTWVLFNLGG